MIIFFPKTFWKKAFKSKRSKNKMMNQILKKSTFEHNSALHCQEN